MSNGWTMYAPIAPQPFGLAVEIVIALCPLVALTVIGLRLERGKIGLIVMWATFTIASLFWLEPMFQFAMTLKSLPIATAFGGASGAMTSASGIAVLIGSIVLAVLSNPKSSRVSHA